MTPTPKAEEAAKKLADKISISAYQEDVIHWEDIAEALTAYADERVKEALDADIEPVWNFVNYHKSKARAEALEEAANVCDAKIQDEIEFAKHVKGQAVFQGQAAIDAVSDVAEIIRALKGEATRCTCDIPGKPHSADCPSWKEPS